MPPAARYSLEAAVRQSPPIDTSGVVNDTWVKDKTILITGGASGFGAGFFQRWAAAGASVVIGDINVKKGDQLVRDVQKKTGNQHLRCFHVDVTDWQSQVQFFKDAVRVSPHGGIDTVVASAGMVDRDPTIEKPEGKSCRCYHHLIRPTKGVCEKSWAINEGTLMLLTLLKSGPTTHLTFEAVFADCHR